MIDCAKHEVVSQQLWALLGALIKDEPSVKRTFANVPRHNGKISEPVNEDKALARKELLTKNTNPRPAADMDDLNKALEDWETSRRLFVEADGKLPEDSNERLAFMDMLMQMCLCVWTCPVKRRTIRSRSTP